MSNVNVKKLTDENGNKFSPVTHMDSIYGPHNLAYSDYSGKLERIAYYGTTETQATGSWFNFKNNYQIYDNIFIIAENDRLSIKYPGVYTVWAMTRFKDNTSEGVNSSSDGCLSIYMYDSSGNELAVENEWVRRDYRRTAQTCLTFNVTNNLIGCYFQIKRWYPVNISHSSWMMSHVSFYGWEGLNS